MTQRMHESRAGYVREVEGQATVAVGRGGMMRGSAGQALYWLRSYESTGDPEDLACAATALDRDIELLVRAPDGSLQLNEGWRVLPYINSGAMGVGLAALRMLEFVDRPALEETLRGIERNLGPSFAIQSNLFNGRAGFVYYALRTGGSPWSALDPLEEAERQLSLLQVHAVSRRAALSFPGEQLMRLATDWSTGSAGVLGVMRLVQAARREPIPHGFRFPMLGVDRLAEAPTASHPLLVHVDSPGERVA